MSDDAASRGVSLETWNAIKAAWHASRDNAPELGDGFFARADVYEGPKLIHRGQE